MTENMEKELIETMQAMRRQAEKNLELMERVEPYLRAIEVMGKVMGPTLEGIAPDAERLGDKLAGKFLEQLGAFLDKNLK